MKAPYVLITGASEGIGLEFTKLFAQARYPLILVARNLERLTSIARELGAKHQIEIRTISKDLSLSTAADELKSEFDQEGIDVEILVNNAGFGVHGPFQTSDWQSVASMLNLNMITLTRLTHLLLPDMLKKKNGRILNVASTAAFQPGPFMACYFATKAYVLSFTEAIAEEVSGTGVTVTAFCPGPTKTQFQKRSQTEHIRENTFSMEAAPSARAAYEALMKGQRLVIPGIFNKLLAILVRFAPKRLVLRITRFLEEKPKTHTPARG